MPSPTAQASLFPARRLRSFLRLPVFTQAWAGPLLILLGLAQLSLLIVSFRHLAPLLGREVRGAAPPDLNETQRRRAVQIANALRVAASHAPWPTNCFPKALAARVMLALYGVPYALFLGVARHSETHEFMAHAWVRAGAIHVTGGDGAAFTILTAFVSSPGSGRPH
jgi:hypothetical protein